MLLECVGVVDMCLVVSVVVVNNVVVDVVVDVDSVAVVSVVVGLLMSSMLPSL